MTFQTLPWRDAVLSGFRLVNRRPVAALSWALVFFLGGTVMAGLQVWAGGAWKRDRACRAPPSN